MTTLQLQAIERWSVVIENLPEFVLVDKKIKILETKVPEFAKRIRQLIETTAFYVIPARLVPINRLYTGLPYPTSITEQICKQARGEVFCDQALYNHPQVTSETRSATLMHELLMAKRFGSRQPSQIPESEMAQIHAEVRKLGVYLEKVNAATPATDIARILKEMSFGEYRPKYEMSQELRAFVQRANAEVGAICGNAIFPTNAGFAKLDAQSKAILKEKLLAMRSLLVKYILSTSYLQPAQAVSLIEITGYNYRENPLLSNLSTENFVEVMEVLLNTFKDHGRNQETRNALKDLLDAHAHGAARTYLNKMIPNIFILSYNKPIEIFKTDFNYLNGYMISGHFKAEFLSSNSSIEETEQITKFSSVQRIYKDYTDMFFQTNSEHNAITDLRSICANRKLLESLSN